MKLFKKRKKKPEPIKDLPTYILNNYRSAAQRKREEAQAALAEA